LAGIALAVLIFVSFPLHATTTPAALLFFVFIVLISLWARFVMPFFGCILAGLGFNYFFAFPIFDLQVSVSRDIVLVIALSTTGLVMSRLMTSV
jgi:K+-sensing histidine kinase KdpD